MGKLRVDAFSISLDGYGAGPDQDMKEPLGRGGESLHEWMFPTRTFKGMSGKEGKIGVDDTIVQHGFENVGAWIMGRNMFGPVRGPWPDDSWTGWWGEEPPFHHDVFVLTHHPRVSVSMAGGTTFHFVTDGIEAALERARAGAGDGDVAIGGGANVIQQYLAAGLVDEFQLHVVPILLGGGVRLFEGDAEQRKFEQTRVLETPGVTHLMFRVR